MKKIYSPVFILILIIGACSLPNEPKLPQWEVSLNRIPLAKSDTLFIGEELSEDNLIPDEDNLYHIRYDSTTRIGVYRQMRQEPVHPEPINYSIGNFSINANEELSINIFEVLPNLLPYEGKSVVVPSVDFTIPPKDITFNNLNWVGIVSGQLNVTLTNNFNFPLGKPIQITVIDANSEDVIGSVNFDEILPANGGSDSKSMLIEDMQISNELRLLITGHEDGSNSTPVLITGDQVFTITISLVDVQADGASGIIPEQTFQISEQFDISTDSIRVYSAVVRSGSISVSLFSEFEFSIELDITLPGVRDDADKPIQRNVTIQPWTEKQFTIDLANTSLELDDGKMAIDETIAIHPGEDTFYDVHASSSVVVSVGTSFIRFYEITGRIDAHPQFPRFKELEEEKLIDLDFDIPDIRFDDAIFSMVIKDNPAYMDISLTLTGIKEDEAPVQANYSFNLIGDVTNTVMLTNSGVTVNGSQNGVGSGLIDVMNMLPQYLAVSGSAHMQDDSVTLSSPFVIVDYSIDVPFIISLPEDATIEGDTLELDDDSQDLFEHIQNAKLEMKIANGIPLGGTIYMRVADSTITKSKPIEQWSLLTTMTLNPAQANAAGDVINIKDQDFVIDLDKDQFDLLSQSDFMILIIELTPLQKFKLKTTDMIIVRESYVTGIFKVDNSLVEDDDKYE